MTPPDDPPPWRSPPPAPPAAPPAPPSPRTLTRPGHVTGRAFYGAPTPPRPEKHAFLRRTAASPWRLAGLLTLVGFWSVFVSQANIIHQIVLGAPIFEEFFKVGLALALATLLRVRPVALRFVIGLVPGAGFGILEHYTRVWFAEGESDLDTLVRVAFHAGSTGLSMVVYSALETLGDVRVRWGLTVPSSVLHYLNNVLAIVFGVAGVTGAAVETVGTGVSAAITAVVWFLALLLMVAPGPLQTMVRRRFPDRARPAAGPGAAPTSGPPG